MTIRVRLYATLSPYEPRPPELELPEGARVADALRSLSLPEGQAVILLVDGRASGPDAPLAHGDTLSIVPPVGGG